MTRAELHDCIVGCITLSDPPYPTVKIEKLVEEIWGQPFDGETEKINTAKSASLTSAIPQTNPAPFVSETEKITPQPISTAPKGERIQLYCQHPTQPVGWWQIGMMCLDVHRWIDDDYEPDWMLVQPSYWLPLPQPPQPQ
jgi:hypothetical protein